MARWKEGAAHAPKHEVQGAIIADLHGGDWRKYAKYLKNNPQAFKALSEDRVAAWDVLMEIA